MKQQTVVRILVWSCTTTSLAAAQRPTPYPVEPPREYRRAVEQGTRTPDGAPGAAYWQQWTDYRLTATVDPVAKRLEGTAQIVYHNNSPRRVPVIFLHLLQNLHRAGAVRSSPQEITGGIELRRVAVGDQTLDEGLQGGSGYLVRGTILTLRLPEAVASGERVTVEIAWSFRIPENSAGRMGWDGDDLLYLAYWYPQMAVLDDVVGWHVDSYLGGAEFYSGFGSYDLTVDVPEGWVVMGTGRLVNARDVLAEAVHARLQRAERSDTVVHVLTPPDFGPGRATRTSETGRLRWHFVADTVRDVAFSVTRASRWDAARTPVGDRDGDGQPDHARVDAFWRESAPVWRQAWRYAQHAIDFLSRWTGLSYPWPHMTSVEGGGIIGGGMEFPMMTLIGDYNRRGDSALYYVHAHELAHMWVPMMVGSDERRYAWMDEGTTTFNENQARKEFYPGPDHDLTDHTNYVNAARSRAEAEIMRWSDFHYPGQAYGVASYSKPATLLAALRALLGEEPFLRAYREYLSRWRFKHPKPWDFFRTFNAVTGRDLDWFWHTWYYETWTLDQAVAAVETGDAETRIVIEDRGYAPMPVRLLVTRADGSTSRHEIPVDTWLTGATTARVTVSSAPPVTRVEIDPEHAFPDINRRDNVWERSRP